MNNPLSPKPEEILKGGQITIVISFVATFLLGIVFVYVVGNLLGQVSDSVHAINAEMSGMKKVVVSSSANACLYAYVESGNTDVLNNTDKTDAVKMEEILNSYDSEKISALSDKVLDCMNAATPSYIEFKAKNVVVAKTGDELSVESALNAILQ